VVVGVIHGIIVLEELLADDEVEAGGGSGAGDPSIVEIRVETEEGILRKGNQVLIRSQRERLGAEHDGKGSSWFGGEGRQAIGTHTGAMGGSTQEIGEDWRREEDQSSTSVHNSRQMGAKDWANRSGMSEGNTGNINTPVVAEWRDVSLREVGN